MKNILVVGGTRYFGIPMVNTLLKNGHDITIATRGNSKPVFDGIVTGRIRTIPCAGSEAIRLYKFQLWGQKRMIDGHIHIERGDYTPEWIQQFVTGDCS